MLVSQCPVIDFVFVDGSRDLRTYSLFKASKQDCFIIIS